MKKKILCLLLGICLCISFSLPLYAIDGTISADDEAGLVVPTLEITNAPTGAAAIARNLNTNQTYYYRMNGNLLSNNSANLYEPGWMPESHHVDVVIGDDNRELVSFPQYEPYSAIAWIQMTYPNGKQASGTAALISPNVALTAAHNLYYSNYGGWATEVEVYPAMSGSPPSQLNAPFGFALASEVVISLPYFENGRGAQWDWGVIRLDSNIGNSSGFLGLQYLDFPVSDFSAMISGYPGDLNGKVNEDDAWDTINQYKHSGLIYYDETSQITISNHETYETRYFSYTIDATQGQSGSPILRRLGDDYIIIGIHSQAGGHVDNEYYDNKGFGLTSEVFQFLVTYKSTS